MEVRGYVLKKQKVCIELNKRVEAATSIYSATAYFLQYIYSVLVAKYVSLEEPIKVFSS